MQCHTILYTRKSSEDDDRQTLSLSAQETECSAYARREGVTIDEVIREAHSAKQPGRPQFTAMLQRARGLVAKGQRVRILCHKPDRLLRNIGDWAKVNDLMETGVEFLFVTGSYPNNAQGKMVFGINVVFAKYYVDNLSEEVKKGLREKLARGEWPGPAPLGYRNEKRKIVIDPDVAPLIRHAFKLYATGEHSLASLVQRLTDIGLRGRLRARAISRSTLATQVLANPFYCGLMRFRGELHAGSHEPIVSMELFRRVQDVLHGRSRPRRIRHEFRYGGVLNCAECGCAVVGDIKKSRYIYYRCSHRRGPCGQGYIRQEQLADAVHSAIASRLALPRHATTALREIGERLAAGEGRADEERRATIERRLRDLEQKLAALLDLRLAGHLDDPQYLAKREELIASQARLREDLVAFELPAIDVETALNWFAEACSSIPSALRDGDNAESREVLRIVGSNYLLRDGIVTFEPVEPFAMAARAQECSTWLAGPDDVRTIQAWAARCGASRFLQNSS